MNADDVRALVAANFPGVLNGPLTKACAGFTASDAADRAVTFASMQARADDAETRRLHDDAMVHALTCVVACDGWTVETLGHNIASHFGIDLGSDACDDIARQALGL